MKRLPFLPLVAAAAAAMAGCSSPPPQTGWEYTGGPEAQNVTAIVGAPGNPDVLTAAMSSGYVRALPTGGGPGQRYPRPTREQFAGCTRMPTTRPDSSAWATAPPSGRPTAGGRGWRD